MSFCCNRIGMEIMSKIQQYGVSKKTRVNLSNSLPLSLPSFFLHGIKETRGRGWEKKGVKSGKKGEMNKYQSGICTFGGYVVFIFHNNKLSSTKLCNVEFSLPSHSIQALAGTDITGFMAYQRPIQPAFKSMFLSF